MHGVTLGLFARARLNLHTRLSQKVAILCGHWNCERLGSLQLTSHSRADRINKSIL